MPKRLADWEIERRLQSLKGWKSQGEFIVKVFQFDEFMQGIRFVEKVAAAAEKEEHHPDINVRYTTVTLSIQTHSEGGVTEWDLELAHAIEKTIAPGGRRNTPKRPARA